MYIVGWSWYIFRLSWILGIIKSFNDFFCAITQEFESSAQIDEIAFRILPLTPNWISAFFYRSNKKLLQFFVLHLQEIFLDVEFMTMENSILCHWTAKWPLFPLIMLKWFFCVLLLLCFKTLCDIFAKRPFENLQRLRGQFTTSSVFVWR